MAQHNWLASLAAAMGGVYRWASRCAEAYSNNPVARERMSALTAFGFIFAFGLLSLDYIITGGPDWNPGAAAAPLTHVQVRSTALYSEMLEAPPSLPEFDLATFEPEGPVGELLGGPETRLPNAVTTFAGGEGEQLAAVLATSTASVRKLKARGA